MWLLTGSLLSLLLILLRNDSVAGHNIEHLPDWLVLISMDGFRHDYVDLAEKAGFNVTAFRRLQREGVSGRTVIDDFVSKTFPNHYTIVTGLHEENHGVIGNSFYDPDSNRVFNVSNNAETAMWDNGTTGDSGPEPLWVTAQRQKLRSAVINWPSSAAKIKSAYPTYSFGLFSFSNAMRADYYIERIANWFETDNHCRLALLYLPEPDFTGHAYGPNSTEVLKIVQKLNDHLNSLLNRFASSKALRGRVNIVLTSDHGMTNLDLNRVIFMDEIVDRSLYRAHSSYDHTYWQLWPVKGKEEEVYQKLKTASDKSNQFRVMRRGDPWLIRSHFNYNRRISPIMVLANLGAVLVWNRTSEDYNYVKTKKRIGDHGYNNSEPDMHPIFFAWGPAFVANRTVSRVRLVDIYPLCCRLLGIHPAAHDAGSDLAAPIKAVLTNQDDDDDDEDSGKAFFYLSSTLVTTFASFLLVACFTSVFALGAMRAYRTSLYRRNRRFGLLDDDSMNSGGGIGGRGGRGSNHNDHLPLSLDDEDL